MCWRRPEILEIFLIEPICYDLLMLPLKFRKPLTHSYYKNHLFLCIEQSLSISYSRQLLTIRRNGGDLCFLNKLTSQKRIWLVSRDCHDSVEASTT